MVTVAVPDPLPVCETALTVTVVAMLPPLPLDFVGTPLGATYDPLVDMNPNVWLPPTMPLTCQLTAVLGAPFTDAVNCCVPKFMTVAALGNTLTDVGAPVTVTDADADFVASACAVAVTVTVNCCVLPAATLTAIGATEIVTVVLLDVPAQPENRTAAQAKLRNKRRRMKD